MNTTTLGYILLITIPIIITLAILAIKRKKKEHPLSALTEEEFYTTIQNRYVIDELQRIEHELSKYAHFLKTRFLKHFPETATEIDQVHKRRRYARSIRTMLQDNNPTIPVTEQRWTEILQTASYLSQLPTLKEMNLTIEELEGNYKEVDQEIEDLIKSGHLPEEYRNSSRTLNPEELRKQWMKIQGYNTTDEPA